MRTVWKYFIAGILLAGIPGTIFALSGKGGEVLSLITTPTTIPSPSPTSTSTPTPSPTPTPTPIPIPSPSPSPTPTPVLPPPVSPQEIHAFIERFSSQYGVDPNVLRHIATCESGFNPLAVNEPYVGLYQFGKSSWTSNRLAIGEDTNLDLRFSAEESAQTAAYVISIGKGNLWPNCFP